MRVTLKQATSLSAAGIETLKKLTILASKKIMYGFQSTRIN